MGATSQGCSPATSPSLKIAIAQVGLGADGAEKIVRLLATHSDKQGHRVTVLAITEHPGESFYPFPEGVTLRTMEEELGRKATRSAARRIAWLRRALRESEADLVVSFLTKINIQVAIAARGLGIRRIASERNNFVQQKMKPHWRLLMPIALATAEVAVMQTHAARTALPAWARKRAVVIHNPVPEGIERSIGAPPPRRLVAVGRLTEQKGFDILVRAVGQAHERNCPFHLTIYGEGKDRKRLADLVQSLGLSGRIRLAGRTQRPHEWTKGAGIFVLSSRFEGFPNVLVEAMAAGFAVVSTNCDWGPSEVLTHGRDGLLVPPNDPKALADALVELWQDDALRTQFAQAAALRAADFSEQRILSEWDAAIAQALGAQARATSEAPSRP